MEKKENKFQQLNDDQLQQVAGGMHEHCFNPDQELATCISKGESHDSCCRQYPTASECRQY